MGSEKKDINKEAETYKPIVFVNNPIKDQKDDIVGFESQVETLECAINEGANLIGVIADYGTGKSSLTDILSISLRKKKKIIKPIKINLWDCLESNTNANNVEKVSLLTRSFLYQLSNGYGQKFGSFINKILSKNYGNISFGVSSTKFWLFFVLAGLAFALFKISTVKNTGIMQFLPEHFNIIASYVKLLSPAFLLISCLLLILGIKDTYIAYSHWKMEEKRELEINDIFDTYSAVIKKIKPFSKKKKRLIIVEDLDRVAEEKIITDFLKELYRFHDSLGSYSTNFVFIVSIKPESLLKKSTNNDDNKIYSKLFDVVISLKPIHFDDYDSVLIKLINNNPEQKEALKKLIDANFDNTLPQSFKWIKKGENLTLRDLKDRLNQAISIMLSIKNKNYKVSTSADFEACAAIAYFESRYPKEYYKLIRNESQFASFMRTAMPIINTASDGVLTDLSNSFNNTFENTNHTKFSKNFVEELCGLVAEGIFNDDFRMYFYTYPKGSPIKTTDERELCNYILFPNIYKTHENLDEVVSNVFKDGKNTIIENTLKSLEKYPPVILENTVLFVAATKVSVEKSFSVFSEEIIESNYDDNYKSKIWKRLKALNKTDYSNYIQKSIKKILNIYKEANGLIGIRKSIIMGLGSDISLFKKLYEYGDKNLPLITEEEMKMIDNVSICLEFIRINRLKKDDFSYVTTLINSNPIDKNSETFEIACEVFNRFLKILTPQEISEELLRFLVVNQYLNNSFFKIISESELDLESIAIYLNMFSEEDFSDEYIRIIDEFGFNDFISENIVIKLLKCGYYYTAILFYSNKNELHKLSFHTNEISKMIDVCKKINENFPDVICNFREYVFNESSIPEYKKLYFDPFPIITEKEYVSLSSSIEPFKMIDTYQIDEECCSAIMGMICKKTYSSDEIVAMFDWLFNEDENENCVSDASLREKAVDNLDFTKLDPKKLSENQRDYIFNLISDVFAVKTSTDAINSMKKLNCLIPSLEELAQNDKEEYLNFVANLDEVTSQTLNWFDANYISIALSEKICKILYERKDYCNYIIADVLRKRDMIIDETIPFDDYISVYVNVKEMFGIMSNHYDFLERLQLEADFEKLSNELIIPIFKVPQHERFFNYIFSDKQSNDIKKEYLKNFGKFASLDDSIAFQRLMCKEENMNLLGDESIFSKIHRNLWELNRGHKGAFTRKWNERWKDKNK